MLVLLLVCLTWRVGGLLVFGENKPMAQELPRVPVRVMLSAAAFMPALVMITLVLSAWRGTTRRITGVAVAVLLGAALHAYTLQASYCLVSLIGFESSACSRLAWHWDYLSTAARASLWGGLFGALMLLERRTREAARALHETQVQRLDAERQESEARLRSLQAQVEPHFLFNTLAHIQHLHAVAPRQGLAMLGSLITYMQAALPQMRQPASTLGRELALCRAYLQVQQIRMGDRLRLEIDVPDDLLDASMPPMMLLTLAENAVKHGLGPRREGGTLTIRARRLQGRLEVVVRDDGVGLRLGSGGGHGLSNTRARLASLFGGKARLDISSRDGGGVQAALSLPHVAAAAAGC